MCKRYPFAWIDRGGESPPRPYRCNTWRCPECAPGKKRSTAAVVGRWTHRLDLTRFVTLTLDWRRVPPRILQRYLPAGSPPVEALLERCYAMTRVVPRGGRGTGRWRPTLAGGTAEERKLLRAAYLRHINHLWNIVRTRLRRDYPDMQYVRIVELHRDSVRPHLHLLVSQYIPRATWLRYWTTAGGGRQLHIKRIEARVEDPVKYVISYLTKSCALDPDEWPDRARHIVVSRGLSLTLSPEEREHLDEWHRTATPDGPCPAGHRPERLTEECDTLCSGCVWRQRRVCRWRLPGTVPRWALVDERGQMLTPPPRSPEYDAVIAALYMARRYAVRSMPEWAMPTPTRRGDVLALRQAWYVSGVPRLDALVPPIRLDRATEWLYRTAREEDPI